jgi:hypothetical protein
MGDTKRHEGLSDDRFSSRGIHVDPAAIDGVAASDDRTRFPRTDG